MEKEKKKRNRQRKFIPYLGPGHNPQDQLALSIWKPPSIPLRIAMLLGSNFDFNDEISARFISGSYFGRRFSRNSTQTTEFISRIMREVLFETYLWPELHLLVVENKPEHLRNALKASGHANVNRVYICIDGFILPKDQESSVFLALQSLRRTGIAIMQDSLY